MGLTIGQRRVIDSKAVRFEDVVLSKLGKEHRDVAVHIFNELKGSIKDMEVMFIPNLGTFGPNRTRIQRACTEGWLKPGNDKICESL